MATVFPIAVFFGLGDKGTWQSIAGGKLCEKGDCWLGGFGRRGIAWFPSAGLKNQVA